MNTEKVKVGLLALIALTLVINTYYLATNAATNHTATTTGNWSTESISNIPNNQLAPSNGAPSNLNQGATDLKNAAVNNPTKNNLTNAANTAPTGPITNIKFGSDFKDFGEVKAQSENTYAFEFINTGTEPLIIENAKGSCGCTVPDWPTEPILPGAKGVIDVVFKPKPRETAGEDKKTVTVTANTNPKATVLTVRALVNP
jgi:hypothetical protein